MMRSTAGLLVKYHHLKYSQLVMKQKHAFCIIAKVFVKIFFRFVAKNACEIKQIRFLRQREKLFCLFSTLFAVLSPPKVLAGHTQIQ
jgi:hypothetical protein